MVRQRIGAGSRDRATHQTGRRPGAHRRGVSSVLAMMFLVIFGSLAAAMAVVAQGNLRTADSALKVSRAMSAAETGLTFATQRLASESGRFVIEKGVVDADYAEDLWLGTYNQAADGAVEVLDPEGYVTSTPPSGLAEALRDAHHPDVDAHWIVVEPGDNALPEIDATYGTLRVRPIALTQDGANGPYFRLKYELLADEPAIRVTSQGIDGNITRTLQMDFRVDKKIEFALLSPNRIMIGKNVRIEGPIGTRYGIVAGELSAANGDPLVMRSDFTDLDPTLDANLATLYATIVQYDTDGDCRLRPNHPVESLGVAANASILVDYDGDEYVTDFDLFMDFYDDNDDGKVVYDSALSGGMLVEFADDDQLARLIDEALADRDGDGVITASDNGLGYKNGVLDGYDLYAKVHGRLAFAVTSTAWNAANGASYQTIVNGPVRHDIDEAPSTFAVPDDDMREILTSMVDSGQSWFSSNSFNTFDTQATAQDGATGTIEPAGVNGWEAVPYGSAGAYDYYQRPVYRNMTFTNVRIPKGTNALFEDCVFVGVTFIEAEESCDHVNWNYAGAVEPIETPPGSNNYVYQLRFPDLEAEVGGTTVPDTRLESNNLRFNDCVFLGSVSGNKPTEFTHWRNKLQFTGETRFYVDPGDPDLAADPHPDATTWQATLAGMDPNVREELEKSSILLPGWSVDVGNFTNEVAANPADTAKVKLRGTIVAGILDARGTVDVFGTLLMTFRPTEADGPLFYGGLPDAFNTTIGYFGPSDGDNEGVDQDDASFNGFGEITLRYNEDGKLPDGIPWPIRVDAEPTTYLEGGSL